MSQDNVIDSFEDKSDQINRYLQKVNKTLEYNYKSSGQSHCPEFTCSCTFEGKEFSANAKSKKEAQKKIKRDIWEFINGSLDSSSSSDKSQNKRGTEILRFSDFRLILRDIDVSKPIYLLDLENIGGVKALQDATFMTMCKKKEAIIICVFARLFPDVTDSDAIFIKRDDLHRDSADEGIRRIVYYLADNLEARNITVITNDHFGQTLKDSLDETYVMTFGLYLSVDEFKVRNSRLMAKEQKSNLFSQSDIFSIPN